MPYSPQQPGEDVAAWQARLEADYAALKDSMPGASEERISHAWQTGAKPTPKHASQMSASERAAAIEAIKRADHERPIVPVMGGKHVRDMTPNERAQAYAQMGHRPGPSSVRFGDSR